MATFGELGPTLLDAIDARVSVNPRQSVTRLMYAATFAEGANDVKVSADHSELVDELAAEAAFTGVLVMNEKAVLHLYEAPCDQALSFLAKLKAKACVGELRVLFSSEDCPERVMNEWSEHRVSRPAETVVSSVRSAPAPSMKVEAAAAAGAAAPAPGAAARGVASQCLAYRAS